MPRTKCKRGFWDVFRDFLGESGRKGRFRRVPEVVKSGNRCKTVWENGFKTLFLGFCQVLGGKIGETNGFGSFLSCKVKECAQDRE